MLDYDKKYGRWLLEETIEDTGNNKEKVKCFLTTYCKAFYQCTSRLRPIGEDIIRTLMSRSNNVVGAKLTKILRDGYAYWPVALGHGDLTPGNMLSDNTARFALCDFERASFRPVARDLTKLYIKNPTYRHAILGTLEDLSGHNRKSMDPESQLAICIALSTIKLEEILDNKRACRANKYGTDPTQARRKIANMIDDNSTIIEALLASSAY